MQVNFTQALALAMQSASVLSNADANHDGKTSGTEIAAAVGAELQAVVMTLPDVAKIVHSDPARLQKAVEYFTLGVKELAGTPTA